MAPLLLVFVHGYSVTNLDTYGELPLRMHNEARARGYDVKIENIFLGRYISFNDEVRLNDVSRAMHEAVRKQIPSNTRFICITHSTGGPVVRNWWHLFYQNQTSTLCPMSHLIMLAPANHGSALAQLGKTRLSRVKSWFEGAEPGQKILDWLELGSDQAWQLNRDWISRGAEHLSEKGIFPFVLTGQDIDRKLYDHINSYTGELGSDGVIRVASANLNTRYIQIKQQSPGMLKNKLAAPLLEITNFEEAPETALRVLTKKSHSGEELGIMRSVKKEINDQQHTETIKSIFDCIAVKNKNEYKTLCQTFNNATFNVQENSRLEIEKKLLKHNVYIHDRYSMVIFKIVDTEGYALSNFDLVLTGPNNDPDMLPKGFFADRQCNKLSSNTLTYYFNYDAMLGTSAIVHQGEEWRKASAGIDSLGLIIIPRPAQGFIRYLPCQLNTSKEMFVKALKPNATTLIEIVLQRVVSNEVFAFEKPDPAKASSMSYKHIKPGNNTIS